MVNFYSKNHRPCIRFTSGDLEVVDNLIYRVVSKSYLNGTHLIKFYLIENIDYTLLKK